MKNSLIENFKVNKSYVYNIKNYRKYNSTISNYFNALYKETNQDVLKNTADRIRDCNRVWLVNYYKDINVKELKKTHLCHNKFCFNCKKVTQAFRMAKYSDLIRSQENCYHLVLTLPSVSHDKLKDTLKLMSKSFRRLYYILAGKDKFTIPFNLVVVGALRSLEITFSKSGFHPHYHVLLVFKNKYDLNKHVINKFSYSYRKLTRVFSDLEVYIQKLWQCLIEGIRLNKIDTVDGYSCILDEFKEGDFLELFKYMCKEADMVEKVEGEEEKEKFILSYKHFKTLYYATYRIKQLQGYGTLYRVKDDFDLEELHEKYDIFIEYLNNISECDIKYEYTSKEELEDKYSYLKENSLAYEEFINNYTYIDIDKYDYISFKSYVNFVNNL